MKFDSEFVCILSGTIRSEFANFGSERETHEFGEHLLYINAAVSTRILKRIENEVDEASALVDDDTTDENETRHQSHYSSNESDDGGEVVEGEFSPSGVTIEQDHSVTRNRNNRIREEIELISSRLRNENVKERTLRLVRGASLGAYGDEQDPIMYLR
mmetsp:Transcript_21201/g.31006  ORF Transcript_21201/g.31006 Transcript_21201/m.31006 type:complete len:158 (+) Transcript_21201:417-890(+)